MADTIYNILVHTYHPDKTLRENAEKALEEYVTTVPSAMLSLISIVKGCFDSSEEQNEEILDWKTQC